MSSKLMRWSRGALAGATMLFGTVGSSFAGSTSGSDIWAGDVNALALPSGTFVVLDYVGWRHADALGNEKADVSLLTNLFRVAYFTQLWNHPLVLQAVVPSANVMGDATINGVKKTKADGIIDPVLFVTYGLISDPRMERFLGLTNYVYLPAGRRYDKFKDINVNTPNQTTWVPEIAYAEGLGKFGLKNLWLDVIASASIHSDGDSPLALAPGFQFDKLTQDNTYDLRVFLRYEFAPLTHVALGIEKSWGGEQRASGGLLQNVGIPGHVPPLGVVSLGKEDFTKGHIQVQVPLRADLQIGADITHDFQREGGLREDITAEVRVTKAFLPQAPLK